MKTIANKIQQHYRENGFARSVIWLSDKSVRALLAFFVNIRITYVIERNLDVHVPEIRTKLPVTFRPGTAPDFESFREVLKPWRRFRSVFEDRCKHGKPSIVCFHENRAIGYIWMTDVPEKDKNLGITIEPGETGSYGYDLYVMPAYRKDLIGGELISRWLNHAKETGKRKAIGVVASYNQPMLMMTRLMFGFNRTKELRSLEVFRSKGFLVKEKEITK